MRLGLDEREADLQHLERVARATRAVRRRARALGAHREDARVRHLGPAILRGATTNVSVGVFSALGAGEGDGRAVAATSTGPEPGPGPGDARDL